ncbi:hypothetical protein HPB48_016363 [Haemaphysalis longicornis]|uniref:Uncharacterized protein n=1 Tax=Haemaphysalis longicornis TaxID=44386 RepID=A0A9J6GDK5_HAELO|nr:hypothetical protein HPB48_016363 [Haemaphysalis longicornis]
MTLLEDCRKYRSSTPTHSSATEPFSRNLAFVYTTEQAPPLTSRHSKGIFFVLLDATVFKADAESIEFKSLLLRERVTLSSMALLVIAAMFSGVVVFVRYAFVQGKMEARSSGLISEKLQKRAPHFLRVQVRP